MDTPTTVPGPTLAAHRKAYGISRQALADRLGLHRNTLMAWENAHEVTVLRQRRYLAALRELVEQIDGAA